MHVRIFLSRFRAYIKCPHCDGTRLQPEALCWLWNGFRLPDLYELPIKQLYEIVSNCEETDQTNLTNRQSDIAFEAILSRLRYLNHVGLGYLTLNRPARTLSGGEVERVTLTSCLGTSLVDTLFVLDEPSVGLHARDIDRLIQIVRTLTDSGNTVVVVEHDDAMILAADHILEIGPEPGAKEVTSCSRVPRKSCSPVLRASQATIFPGSGPSTHQKAPVPLNYLEKGKCLREFGSVGRVNTISKIWM